MLKKLSKPILCLLTVFCILFTACNSKKVQNTFTPSQISKDLEFLCSDECGGREHNTKGNKKARDYICNRFKKIGLEPLNNNYLIPYKNKVRVINKVELELYDNNKPAYKFKYGTGFTDIVLMPIELTLPVYTQPKNEDCIILGDDPKKIIQYEKNPHTKLTLLKTEKGFSRSVDCLSENCVPSINISNETYKKLNNNIGKKLHFVSDIDIKKVQEENIAGVIKGENNDKAMIISAHYDHIGSIGDIDSKNYVVWRGALDNASGICTMLETAKALKKIYKDKKPPYDIVFAAFNCEETIGPIGSSYFLNYLKEKYSYAFDINIDCLGQKDNSKVSMFFNKNGQSKNAFQLILKNLKSQNINAELSEENYTSDHRTFDYAVCFTNIPDLNKTYIHSTEDTIDKIDTDFISKFSKKLSICIEDVIDKIDIDKMQLTPSVYYEEELSPNHSKLTCFDFEKRFNYKLNFIFPKSLILNIYSRIGMFKPISINQKNSDINEIDHTPKDISDIRSISFFKDNYNITFTTYKTKNIEEMKTYKEEMDINGFDKSKSKKITINNTEYNIFTFEKDKFKTLTKEFKNKDILIRVSINSPHFYNFKTLGQYRDFFKQNDIENIINEMIKMFFKKG